MKDRDVKTKNWVAPGSLSGAIDVPSSKSIALRYLLLASVAEGESIVRNVTYCEDVLALLSNFESLGITHSRNDSTLTIKGGLWNRVENINCGESGFLARTLPFLCAAQRMYCKITGSGTLLRRDLSDLVSVFQAAGGENVLSGSQLPLQLLPFTIKEEIAVSKQTSSQALSGLLLALPLTNRRIGIKIDKQPSRGYIILTKDAMRKFGASFREKSGDCDILVFSPKRYVGCDVSVPGDWSGVAQLVAALQVGDVVLLRGIEYESAQPDRSILELLDRLEIAHCWVDSGLEVRMFHRPSRFSFDATNCPDLFPALAAMAAQCEGESRIVGVGRLRNKESDRGAALLAMLNGFGIQCRIDGDTLYVVGGTAHPTGVIPCAHDHRIAMAAGAIALRCSNGAYLDDTGCVRKSFPYFFDILSHK